MKATLIEGAVRALASTWRIEVRGAGALAEARARGPVLFAPWHEALIPLVWHHRHQGITLLVGQHADGSLLARVASRLGYGVVRGSSTRGGAAGLRALIRCLASRRDGAITPDGPRGPARVVKAGVLKAAQEAGAVILPVTARAHVAVRLRSWDRMLVPGPGARVCIEYGAGLAVARHGDLTSAGTHLQSALDQLACAS